MFICILSGIWIVFVSSHIRSTTNFITYVRTIGYLVSLPPETPTLMNLLSFSKRGVNIAEQIGVNYVTFGMILLQDMNGAVVKALEKEHRGNAEDINIAIFQKWLNGKGMRPVTWSTLVTALQTITTWK